MNKNVKRLARKSAFSLKAQQKNITVVEDFQFDAPKTKSFQAALSALGISDKKSLWVLGQTNKNVFLSGRNLTKTEVLTNDELNAISIEYEPIWAIGTGLTATPAQAEEMHAFIKDVKGYDIA